MSTVKMLQSALFAAVLAVPAAHAADRVHECHLLKYENNELQRRQTVSLANLGSQLVSLNDLMDLPRGMSVIITPIGADQTRSEIENRLRAQAPILVYARNGDQLAPSLYVSPTTPAFSLELPLLGRNGRRTNANRQNRVEIHCVLQGSVENAVEYEDFSAALNH
jgi:hypothetical protein